MYRLYVEFERRYAEAVLASRSESWDRCSFLRTFAIATREEFWHQFHSHPLHRQEALERKWRMGYDRHLERFGRRVDRILGRMTESTDQE